VESHEARNIIVSLAKLTIIPSIILKIVYSLPAPLTSFATKKCVLWLKEEGSLGRDNITFPWRIKTLLFFRFQIFNGMPLPILGRNVLLAPQYPRLFPLDYVQIHVSKEL
jgi:hypothetical protein